MAKFKCLVLDHFYSRESRLLPTFLGGQFLEVGNLELQYLYLLLQTLYIVLLSRGCSAPGNAHVVAATLTK